MSTLSDHQVEHYGSIGRLLRSPVESIDLATFCDRFQARRIRVRLADMAAAAREPALIGRLRGALGDVLMRTASPQAASGRPCPWDPPSAFEALFRKQGRMTPGTDFPSPWVLALQPRRGALDVMLTLFGVACEWAPAAAEALVEGCARIDWRSAAGVFVPAMAVIDRRMQRVAIEEREIGQTLVLEFLSPLVVSSQNPVEAPAAAFKSFSLRLEGLARWHGLTLAAVDWGAMKAALRAADWTWTDTEFADWRRGSRRQDRWIAMSGVLGRLHIAASHDAMMQISPLLRLGANTHVGADIAFGCGRYRILELVDR
ncbi:MAG: CRISPR system precrRNA processing endoribonuclease RAMP protein Cas6 [Roseiarcus sp.]|jgi:hypothetical protein